MTQPRYYYDDPISAAWMLEEFGIRITKDDINYSIGDAQDFLEHIINHEEGELFTYRYRYYIPPHSLPILEPKGGDLYESEEILNIEQLGYVDNATLFIKELERARNLYLEIYGEKLPFEIIRRNRKPFHYPKVES